MPVVTNASAITEHLQCRRRHRNTQFIPESDPIPSIIHSTRCKSTISSLLLSTFSNNASSTIPGTTTNIINKTKTKTKKNNNNNNFSSTTFRGLGCTAGASQQVSVPVVIRTSADWQGKKTRKKKHKKNSNKNNGNGVSDASSGSAANCVGFQDVWCGPGIGFSADAAESVDCVVARKNNVSARGKIDVVDRIAHREVVKGLMGVHKCCQRLSYLGRRDTISFMDDDPDIFPMRPASDSFGTARYYHRHHHIRHDPSSSEGFAEIMMLQGGLLMGGILDSYDQYRDWRLDVDNMSYEQLLELGERIGHVNTGLKEDEIGHHIRKIQLPFFNDALKHHHMNKKCSICQEEYEGDDEVGKLNCEHSYHFQCIRQWLAQKNFCPVCKQEVVARH